VEIFNLGRWQCPVAPRSEKRPADVIGVGRSAGHSVRIEERALTDKQCLHVVARRSREGLLAKSSPILLLHQRAAYLPTIASHPPDHHHQRGSPIGPLCEYNSIRVVIEITTART
jgi:hypothetical protein